MAGTVYYPLSEKIENTPEPVPETTTEKRLYWNAHRSSWFGCILYPDEDRKHQVFMDYMERNKTVYPKYVYIVHDRDVYTEDVTDADGVVHLRGSPKKRHIHYIFKRSKTCPASTVQNYFGCWVNHFEALGDYECYIQYMLHNDPKSIDQGKPQYFASELVGDPKVIQNAVIQNAKYALLNELFDMFNDSDRGTVKEVMDKIRNDKPDLFPFYLDVWREFGYIIRSYGADVERERYDEFIDRAVFSELFDADTADKIAKLYWKGNRYR